jgi:hypothetical protein
MGHLTRTLTSAALGLTVIGSQAFGQHNKVAPSHSSPGGGGGMSSGHNYSTPNYSTPNYSTPNYSTPNYSTPNYSTPNYNTPHYATPNYNTPNYNTPNYNTPNYNNPNTGNSFYQQQQAQQHAQRRRDLRNQAQTQMSQQVTHQADQERRTRLRDQAKTQTHSALGPPSNAGSSSETQAQRDARRRNLHDQFNSQVHTAQPSKDHRLPDHTSTSSGGSVAKHADSTHLRQLREQANHQMHEAQPSVGGSHTSPGHLKSESGSPVTATHSSNSGSPSREHLRQMASTQMHHHLRSLAHQQMTSAARVDARQRTSGGSRNALKPIDPAVTAKLSPEKQTKLAALQDRVTKQMAQSRLPQNKGPHKPQKSTPAVKGALSSTDNSQLKGLAQQDPKLQQIFGHLTQHKPIYKGDSTYLKQTWATSNGSAASSLGSLLSASGKPKPNVNALGTNKPSGQGQNGKLWSAGDLNTLKGAAAVAVGAGAINLGLAILDAMKEQACGTFCDAMEGACSDDGAVPCSIPIGGGDGDLGPVADGVCIPSDPNNPDGSGVALAMIPSCTCDDGSAAGGQTPVADTDNSDTAIPDPGNEPLADIGPAAADVTAEQSTRFLRVANYTDTPITLNLQFEAQTSDGNWQWVPGDPSSADQTETFELAAGEITDLFDNDWRINASRVRIWATTASGDNRLPFKDRDLWLVPEKDDQGAPGYESREIQTFFLAVY